MIVTGGENVYSGKVEAVIYKHPAVREMAVSRIPDPQWGELAMACVVLKPRMVLSANDLIGHCRQFLANCKIPRRVEFSDTELPKSDSGKILNRILRERFWVRGCRDCNSGIAPGILRRWRWPFNCKRHLTGDAANGQVALDLWFSVAGNLDVGGLEL